MRVSKYLVPTTYHPNNQLLYVGWQYFLKGIDKTVKTEFVKEKEKGKKKSERTLEL